MLSLEPELQELRPYLGDARVDERVARERREIFSIYPEVRVMAWAGAMLLAGAAAVVLKNNLERIGPVVLSIGIALAAAACYAWVWTRRDRPALADDYILLLGALLLSADLAFIETQFHVFGRQWPRHFLVAAIVHGAGAYAYRSRTVLSLSVAALAAWMGIERTSLDSLRPAEYALRAFGAAAVVLGWRAVNRRPEFGVVFEHFAANLALSGGMALVFDRSTRAIGTLLVLLLAAAVIWWGFRVRRESFALYAFLYGVVALDVWLLTVLGAPAIGLLVLIVSLIGAVIALIMIHDRFRRLGT